MKLLERNDTYYFHFNLIPNQVHILLLFEIWPVVYQTISSFSGCESEKSAFKVSYSYIVLDLKGCRKCIFYGKIFEKSVRNYMEVIEHIQVCKKQKSQNRISDKFR